MPVLLTNFSSELCLQPRKLGVTRVLLLQLTSYCANKVTFTVSSLSIQYLAFSPARKKVSWPSPTSILAVCMVYKKMKNPKLAG